MDPEGIHGDVLVCNPSPSLISSMCLIGPSTSASNTIPTEEEMAAVNSIDKKPKRKRNRQRKKKSMQEVDAVSQVQHDGLSYVPSDFPSGEMVEDMAIAITNSVQDLSLNVSQKPKKDGTQKKELTKIKSKNREINNQLGDINKFFQYDYDPGSVELLEYEAECADLLLGLMDGEQVSAKKPRGSKKKNSKGQPSKQNKLYFADNQKEVGKSMPEVDAVSEIESDGLSGVPSGQMVENMAIDMDQNLILKKRELKKIKSKKREINKKLDEIQKNISSLTHCDQDYVDWCELEIVRNVDILNDLRDKEREISAKKPRKKPKDSKTKNSDDQPPKQVVQYFADNQKAESKKKSTPKKKKQSEMFEDYLTASEVEQGLKDKKMVTGSIRINQRSYKEAYLSEGCEQDILIEGLKNRNRALEGDEVVVQLNPPEEWKSNGQRTGKVVKILEEFHSRSCIGKLPSVVEPNNSYIVFSPRDSRIPRIRMAVNDKSIPAGYLQVPQLYSQLLFNVKITSWTDVNFAEGTIVAEVGKCGDVEAETLAIMMENDLDPNPINPLLSVFFPPLPYTIPEEEIAKRLDLRKECIFTIDPATARDLDDAVSVKHLPNGNLEVGVHISDVSFFLNPNTLLDHTVSLRATTVYLVQRVYHMLPVELCHLCSLTPMEDKLAFSVFVELTPDAEVVSHRFARSVINSCTKLAYEHAQMVIDNPEKTFTSEDFPEIGNGFSAEDCVTTIQDLYKLSVILRKQRFDSGALRIDQPKLCFHLDPDTQFPMSSFIYENKESHRLIEEFMLLANMVVAKHIYTTYPKLAFLRHHGEPRLYLMVELQKRLEQCGIHLDISDSGSVHSTILRYSTPLEGEDALLSWARFVVLNNLCAKTMLRAAYFCPTDENQDLHHYALNAPYYTHFTSPIRRYADIIVHRLLAASLDLAPQPSWTPDYTKRIARICNHQKLAAKLAGEQSTQLFLGVFLNEPVETDAAVLDVKDRSMDVAVKIFGVTLRVYTDPLPVTVKFTSDDNMKRLHIKWKNGDIDQYVQLFSVVRVLVSRAKEGLKLTATLLPPLPEDCPK